MTMDTPRDIGAALLDAHSETDGEHRATFGALVRRLAAGTPIPLAEAADLLGCPLPGVDDRTLYAWCALDTLLCPMLLDRPATVESGCAATAVPIRLVVTSTGISELDPPDAVVSLVAPGPGDLRASFCVNVNFYASSEVARMVATARPAPDRSCCGG